jgi:hypothetical protein
MSAMRCPHCAGEIPSGSRFCGICGRGITPAVGGPEVAVEGGRWPPATSPFAPSVESQADSISLFEMPASRAARRARMALVLVLDAILAGAGVVMLMAYFDARGDVRGDATVIDRATGSSAGQGAAEDPAHGGGPASVDQAPGSAPGATAPPDAGASIAPTPAGARARPASTPAPVRRPKPAPKQKSRPAPKSQPVIPDDGSRVDA